MVKSKNPGDEDAYVDPLPEEAIDPLTVDPIGSATSAIDIVPEPVAATSANSAFTALLRADAKKGSTGPIRTTGVSVNTDSIDELDENADIDPEDRIGAPVPVATEPEMEYRVRATQVSYHPESSDQLTADRLLHPSKLDLSEPTGAWNRFVWAATFHRVNRGDSRPVREYKAMSAKIAKRLEAEAKFVPVLTRKGGVGKTTVTTLLGMALADAREDRVIAIDANPDRGTLAERVERQTEATVRDVVGDAHKITGYTGFSAYVSRDTTRLDVLASDTDPNLSEAFNDRDYEAVANLAAQNYSIVLTDCGTGIVHAVMRPVLGRAATAVIVTGSSVDEIKLASETLTWLERNGYEELVRNAVVAVNLATQGAHLVKLEELEAHFSSRVRALVRIPYDPTLAAGSIVRWNKLAPATRAAARDLALAVVDGL
ncbi:MAG TPA: MinD/ParA family protein [Microbacteriaceae bacterium]|nr:MinD/ParA family protein [Microbacteriaceae bacterium]